MAKGSRTRKRVTRMRPSGKYARWPVGKIGIAKIPVREEVLVEKPFFLGLGQKQGIREHTAPMRFVANTHIGDKGLHVSVFRTRWLVAKLRREPSGRFTVLDQLPAPYDKKSDPESLLKKLENVFGIQAGKRIPVIAVKDIDGLR